MTKPLACFVSESFLIVNLYSSLIELMFFYFPLRRQRQLRDGEKGLWPTMCSTDWTNLGEFELINWVSLLCVPQLSGMEWKIASHFGEANIVRTLCIQFVWRLACELFSLHIFNIFVPILASNIVLNGLRFFHFFDLVCIVCLRVEFNWILKHHCRKYRNQSFFVLKHRICQMCEWCVCNQPNCVMFANIHPREFCLPFVSSASEKMLNFHI